MIKQKRNTIFALVLLTGAFFCCSNTFFAYVPKNVQVNGVQVGRLPHREAVSRIRERIAEETPTISLQTPCGEYVFSYPEIGFTDDAEDIVKKAKRNKSYHCRVSYFLKAEDVVLKNICEVCSVSPASAKVSFNGKFTYTAERYGRGCDFQKLKRDVEESLSGSFAPVTLSCYAVRPEKTVEDLKGETVLLSRFSTSFDGDYSARAHNIALAAKSINGTKVEPGEEFSFNRIVGARTRERGYREAKIISGGVFVPGVGGGVCQASTTVYNAALLSGMAITRVQAHSLSVGYVEPSFDAMVSSSSDMSFVNPFSTPVYIAARTGSDRVTVEFYGKPSGLTFKRVSEVLSVIPPKTEILEEGEEESVKVKAKNGMKSQASLLVYRNGVLKEKKQLRKDTYQSVRGVRVVKRQKRAEKPQEKEGNEEGTS